MRRLQDLDDLIPALEPVREESLRDDPLEWARWYVSCGISVIPIKPDGNKKPALASWNPYRERIATDAELKQWFDDSGMFAAGIGIVPGNLSGDLVMFEAETDEGLYALESAMEDHGLTHIWHKLELRVRSGGGGTHLYYRCPGACGSNTKLAQKSKADGGKPIIETRSEGGYAVAPGSGQATHNKGRYTLESGTFKSIPILSPEEQDALFFVARTLDERVEEHQLASRTMPSPDRNGELRPGDDFMVRCTAEQLCELLEKHGWHSREPTPRGYHLTRPGKAARDGSSGAVFEPNARNPMAMFYCHTTSTDFEAGAYNPFAVFAMLEYGDVRSREAPLALRSMGYGSITSNKCINSLENGGGRERGRDKERDSKTLSIAGNAFNAGNAGSRGYAPASTRAFNAFNESNGPCNPEDEWEGEFLPIPPEVLPSWPSPPDSIRRALRTDRLADALGVPQEMVAPIQLSVLATCVQRRAAVVHPGTGHRESLSFWSCVIAPSGSRKSSVSGLSDPLWSIQEQRMDEARLKHDRWMSEDRRIDAYIKDLERQLSKPGADMEAKEKELRAELEGRHQRSKSKPPLAEFLLSDFTPEALDQIMHENDHRAAVFDSEGYVIVSLANVKQGQPVKDINICKYYTGENVTVHRKGGTEGGRSAWAIRGGALSMGILLQGSKIRLLLENPHLMGSGFAARFCYARIPQFTSPYDSPKDDAMRVWDGMVSSLWADLPEETHPKDECPTIELSGDAEAIHRAYRDSIEARWGMGMEALKEWMSKATGCCLRIAAILHFALHRRAAFGRRIEGETLEYAVQIMEFFEANARLLFERSMEHQFSEALAFLDPIVKPERRRFLEAMETNDGIVQRQLFTEHFRTMATEKVVEGMSALESIGWAREVPKKGPGRAGLRWQIRPEALEEIRRMMNRKAEMY